MKLWKRNAVVAAIVLFVCVAVYLNWSYHKDTTDTGKILGQATLVGGQNRDPMLGNQESSSTADMTSGDAASTVDAGADVQQSAKLEDTGSGYFAAARLNRQQARDSALTILQQTAANDNADQTMKDEANGAIQTLADFTVSEAQIENLVTAKGYTDCVAFISDNSVSVVVSATQDGLADADIAKITEIVCGETSYSANQIKIIEATP